MNPQLEIPLEAVGNSYDTRNESYFALDGKETWHRRMIEAYSNYGLLCDRDMSVLIGLPIHLVSARRAELMNADPPKVFMSNEKITYTVNNQKRTARLWGKV